MRCSESGAAGCSGPTWCGACRRSSIATSTPVPVATTLPSMTVAVLEAPVDAAHQPGRPGGRHAGRPGSPPRARNRRAARASRASQERRQVASLSSAIARGARVHMGGDHERRELERIEEVPQENVRVAFLKLDRGSGAGHVELLAPAADGLIVGSAIVLS